MKKNGMKILALLLCIVMMAAWVPATVFPAAAADDAGSVVPPSGVVAFEDDFDGYTGTAPEVGDKYVFANGAPALKAVEGRGNVLDINVNGGGSFASYSFDVKADQLNRILSFDVKFDADSLGTWGGIYAKPFNLDDPNSLYAVFSNSSSAAMKPGITLKSGVESGPEGFGYKAVTFDPDIWYSMKLGFVGNAMAVKIWAAGEVEPAEWTVSGSSAYTPTNAGANVRLEFVVTEANEANFLVDNLCIAYVEETGEPDEPETPVIPDDGKTYLEDVDGMPGLLFPDEAKQPELVESKDGRENVLKLYEKQDQLEIISGQAEKTVTFDFMYEGAFTEYFGIYFVTYEVDAAASTNVGGSILPAFGNQNLMIDTYRNGDYNGGRTIGAATVSSNTWYTCTSVLEGRTFTFTVQKADGTGSPYTITQQIPADFPEISDDADCNFFMKLERNSEVTLFVDKLYMDPPMETPEAFVEDVPGMPGIAFPDEALKPELTESKDGRANVLKFVEAKDQLEIVCDSAEKTVTFDFMYEGAFTQWYGIYFNAYCQDAERQTNVGGSILPAFTAGQQLMIDSYRNGSFEGGRTTAGATVSANTWYSFSSVLEGRTYTFSVQRADGTGDVYSISQNIPADFPALSNEAFTNFFLKMELNTNDNAVLYVDNITVSDPNDVAEVEIKTVFDSELLDVTGAGTYRKGDSVTLTAALKDVYAGIYTFIGWEKSGTIVSTDAEYTFTADRNGTYTAVCRTSTDEPGYTYFADDFESYSIGPASKDTMPANYIDFAEVGNYRIAADPLNPENQVLTGITNPVNNSNLMNMDCEIIDKEVSFDFLYDQAFNSYGGLYVKLHCQLEQDGTTNGYYFSINPNFGADNIIISCNETNIRKGSYTFTEDTWYCVKSRLVDNQIFVKIWTKNAAEPSEWTFSSGLTGFTPVAKGSWFGYEFFNVSGGGDVNICIDNLVMKTWRQLEQKETCTVTVKSADETMGTVSGGGAYLEGNPVKVTAKAEKGYSFVNWTDEAGNIVSDKAIYSFNVAESITLTAHFEETPVVIRSFMAEGLTQVAEIDEKNKTVSLRFASDVDLTNVYPYFYLDAGVEVEQDCYERMDLSQPVTIGVGDKAWTVTATRNGVMAEFYVNPRWGNDAFNGTSSLTAFRTLEAARDAVRAIDGWTGDVIIHLAKGEYTLTETFELGLADSADKGYAVIWQGTGDANEVVINSAQHLDGKWTRSSDVPDLAEGLIAWEYDAAGLTYSRDLYVDGEMAELAGFVTDESAVGTWGHTDVNYMTKTSTGYEVTGILADMYNWHNPTDIEFVYEVGWTYSILPITSVVQNGSGSTVTMKNDAYRAACTKAGVQITDPSSIINCFEGLDTAGEWYFDRGAEKIYYITDGADPNGMDCVIPTLDQLVTVRGQADSGSGAQWVYGVTFKYITFQYTSYLRPHTYGQAEIQASYIVELDSLNWEYYHQHDYFKKTDGGVIAAYTEGMRVSNCIFTNMSAAAMDFEQGCLGSQFISNNITNVGAGGVSVGGVSVRDAQPFNHMAYVNGVLQEVGPDPNRVTQYTLVLSNYLNGIGLSYKGSVGIIAGHVADVTIAHNTITNASYSGVSAGWGWGAWDGGGNSRPDTNYHKFPETVSIQARYVIENNNISGVCQRLADGGAVYTLSLMPGAQLNGNVMHDNPTIFGGVYFDECTGGFTSISDNIIYDVHTIYNYHLQGGFTDRQAAMRELMYGGTNYLGVRPGDEGADERYDAIFANSGYLGSGTGLTPPAIYAVDFDDAAEETEKLVENLPAAEEVTLEDAGAIEAAREAYESLSKEEKAGIDVSKLEAAEEALKELVTAEGVEDMIEKLPAAEDVVLADGAAIRSARAAYEALTNRQKRQVDNVKALEAVEAALEVLENVYATERVLDALLPAADSVETDDEQAVSALAEAKAAYEALSDAEKALVDEVLVDRMEALEAKLTDYQMLSGQDSVMNEENVRDLTFIANGAFSKFVEVRIDGKKLNDRHYEAWAGSTVVKLNASWLETVKPGEHTLTVVYLDGEVSCAFEVTAAEGGGRPATGDGSSLAMWIVLAAVGLGGAAAVTMFAGFSFKKKTAKK